MQCISQILNKVFFQSSVNDEGTAKVPCQFGWDYNTTGLFSSAVTDVSNLFSLVR